MGIPPETSLALAVQGTKGIYALLLGSGISRSAGIPTGWEVVVDLIKKVAKAKGEDPGSDPAAWYKAKIGLEPSYSDVVEQLARTRPEREVLLRPYFEPTDQEREQGLKQPTAAHRAIAKLVSQGFIRVIVSTNFDRLMERALQDEGVQPTVVASPDQADGALPPQHTRCLLIKVHGDYLDTRLRNTRDELAAYEPQLQALLNRVFEEYGAVICGWSGEWDTALGDTLERTTRHRFTTFWMARDGLGSRAKAIVDHRRAVVVPIPSADKAFADLAERVAALDGGRVADPFSPAVGVALVKRLLREPKQNQIALDEFFVGETQSVLRKTGIEAMPEGSPVPNEGEFRDRVARIEAAMATLVPCTFTGVRWGPPTLDQLWSRCVLLLGRHEPRAGNSYPLWSALRRYPATLLLYAIGMGCVKFYQPSLFRYVLTHLKVPTSSSTNEPAAKLFHAQATIWADAGKWLDPPSNMRAPGSERLRTQLHQMIGHLFDHESEFYQTFDRFEVFLSFVLVAVAGHASAGGFAWRNTLGSGELAQVLKEVQSKQGEHFIFQAAIFPSVEAYEAAKELVVRNASEIGF